MKGDLTFHLFQLPPPRPLSSISGSATCSKCASRMREEQALLGGGREGCEFRFLFPQRELSIDSGWVGKTAEGSDKCLRACMRERESVRNTEGFASSGARGPPWLQESSLFSLPPLISRCFWPLPPLHSCHFALLLPLKDITILARRDRIMNAYS